MSSFPCSINFLAAQEAGRTWGATDIEQGQSLWGRLGLGRWVVFYGGNIGETLPTQSLQCGPKVQLKTNDQPSGFFMNFLPFFHSRSIGDHCWAKPGRKPTTTNGRQKWHRSNQFDVPECVNRLSHATLFWAEIIWQITWHPKIRIIRGQSPELNGSKGTKKVVAMVSQTYQKNEWVFTVPAAQHWCRIRASGAPATCSTAWRSEEPQVQPMQKQSAPSHHPRVKWIFDSGKNSRKTIWKHEK